MTKPRLILGLLVIMLVLTLSLQAEYYDNVINLTGQQLYFALRTLISTNTNNSYNDSKAEMFQVLDNVSGNVTCVYTGQVYYVGYSYTGSNDPNTEHTYAQSWFTSSEESIKKADLHHLFVTNSVVNSSRGNLPLTTVVNHSTANVYYTSTPRQSYRGSNFSGIQVFEPADVFKGNIARALLYFNTRYSGQSLVQQNVDMLPVLLQWHIADPPDNAERARNTGIYNFQNNRNPYVDHPEFVGRIWGGTENEDELVMSVPDLQISAAYPNPFGSQVSISVMKKRQGAVSTSIYNVKGQKVFSQFYDMTTGENKLHWYGMDSQGRQVPAGIYIIKVDNGTYSTTARMVKG